MDTSQMTCPKCGWARDLGASECPACGVVYARYGGPPRQASPVFSPPSPSSGDLNPYAPPQSVLESAAPGGPMFGQPAAGVWRSGDQLVMHKGAALPHRCLVCNQPASVQLSRKLYWHHPAIYLLLLLNLVIYAIAALAARKRADVSLPLCAEHADKRKKSTTIAGIVLGLGLAGIVGSFTQFGQDAGDAFATLLGLGTLLFLIGAIAYTLVSRVVVPAKIDDSYAWLKKVGPDYLASLPPAHPGL